MTILSEAAGIVDGARQETYGPPHENHGRTAALWSAYLGMQITARDVCLMNVLQKCGRDRFKPKRDNLVDIAGYAECAQRVTDASPPDRLTAKEIFEQFYGKLGRCTSTLSRSADEQLRCSLDAGHKGVHSTGDGHTWGWPE